MTDQVKKDDQQAAFELQHIYIKDVSFEAPGTPEIFKEKWEPQINIELNSQSRKLDPEIFDVVVTLTVTVKNSDKNAYIAEVQQAGIFMVKNFQESQLEHFLAVYCPNILYPYVREVISSLVIKGGFSPLYLAPVNFEALYKQQKEQATKK